MTYSLLPIAGGLPTATGLRDCNSPLSFVYWFDLNFFVYNILLLTIAVLVIPSITYFYVKYMKQEKLRRLMNDLSEERWKQNKSAIEQLVIAQFRMRSYMGSMLTLTFVVLLGISIILLLKPVPSLGGVYGCGVDYGKGANLLLLGTYISSFGDLSTNEYYQHLLVSLTAFQFGFLGAYVYLISDVVRSYFTLDLTPQTFVAGTIRVVTGSLLALVISFITSHSLGGPHYALPALAFFLGYFPKTALLYLEKSVASLPGFSEQKYHAIALSKLPGMSYLHETRLIREGYDNAENLANARPLNLVLLTGFSYRQIRQWVAQAWLCGHLGEEGYEDFVNRTGITSADELVQFIESWQQPSASAPEEYLNAATRNQYPHKIAILCTLVAKWKEGADRVLTTYDRTDG